MNIFTVQVIVSFFAGGLLIGLQTLIAERVPLRWRGIVLTVPTTMALGFFFIALTKTPEDIVEVARFVPAALMADYVFVLVFAFLAKYGLGISLVGSYSSWALFAYPIVSYPPQTFTVSTFVYALPIIIVCYLFVRRLPQETAITPVPMNSKHVVIRSLIGGSVVVCVVILSKTLGNVWGGLFSAFPAAFTATLAIYYSVHGRSIIPSVAKALFFPGAVGFILYALVASITFPRVGMWWGTLAAYIVVLTFYWLSEIVQRHRAT